MTPQALFDDMVAQGDIVLDKLDECALRMPDKVYIYYGEDNIPICECFDKKLAGKCFGHVRYLACRSSFCTGEFQFPWSIIAISAQRYCTLRFDHRSFIC